MSQAVRQRSIMHLDMDAFYASVEQVDHPELRNRPVIVGGAKRGVVCAASYEARVFGVRSAMPVFQARRLCPKGVFVPVRMSRYREVSRRVMALLRDLSPLVEQVSIDEAYVDLTGTEGLHGPLEGLARSLKARIAEETALTCSIGLAPNKLIAKIASDMDKPDGLTIVSESQVADFMRDLPLDRIPGFGRQTVTALQAMGIRRAGDVSRYSQKSWIEKFGKNGLHLFDKARGIDSSPVTPDRAAKSFGAENTFDRDLSDRAELKQWLWQQTERVARELRKEQSKGRTVTLKVKFSDFKTVTHARTLPAATNATGAIFNVVLQLLEEVPLKRPVRLTGVSVSQIDRGPRQLPLFPDQRLIRQERLDQALDRIREKYGGDVLQQGRVFHPTGPPSRKDNQST